MTAIGIRGVSEGFIVAADGLKSVPVVQALDKPEEAQAHTRTDTQKVFPLRGDDKTVAYALSGYVWNDDPPFDAVKTCSDLSKEFEPRDFSSSTKLVNQFSKELALRITQAKHFPELEKASDGTWHILEIMFAGYFKAAPFLTHVRVTHSYRSAEFRSRPMSMAGLLYGSAVVRRAMCDEAGDVVANSPFSEYIQDPRAIKTLEDCEKYVTGYIQACSSDKAKAMDETYCRKIGGHIDVAEVTPDTFGWRIAPLQIGTR